MFRLPSAAKTSLLLAVTIVALVATVSCGEDTEDSADLFAPCQSKGRVSGIAGRVVPPSCETTVGFAEVALFDQLLFEIATTNADEGGEFAFPAGDTAGDGLYIVRATKGSFSGSSDAAFELSGGQSDFQIVKVGQ